VEYGNGGIAVLRELGRIDRSLVPVSGEFANFRCRKQRTFCRGWGCGA